MVVPVPLIFSPLELPLPLAITPEIVRFALPAKLLVMAAAVFVLMLKPRKSIVFPAPSKVKVLEELFAEMFARVPIFKVVPVPKRVSVLLVSTVTVPVPKSRSLDDLLADVPKFKPLAKVTALLAAFTTAAPLVLLNVPAVRMRVPDPKAFALFTFRVPAVRVTPPDASELFPLKVKVPAVTVVRPL